MTDLATSDEYEVELSELRRSRNAALAVIEGAAAERERLATTGRDYAEVRRLAAEIDEAQFLLEQLDRAEPILLRNLSEIRTRENAARWLEIRPTVAKTARALLPAIEAYRAALDAWDTTFRQVAAEFPSAPEILPRMPGLYYRNGTFAEQIERFEKLELVRAQPAPPSIVSHAAIIDHAKRTGDIPAGIPGELKLEIERALSGVAKIRTLVPILDAEGATVPKNTVIEIPYDDAAAHVAAGRANYY